MIRRHRMWIGTCLVVAAGACGVGERDESATAAADRREGIAACGEIVEGDPVTVTLAESSAGRDLGAGAVVTVAPRAGATLKEGDIALEVGARPVHVLSGAVPMYRDIRPGDRGDDVRQLEEALVRLGLEPGPVDGVFDVRTEAAVDAWYARTDHEALGPGPDERDALREARATIASAEQDAGVARRALADARRPADADEVGSADRSVRIAELAVKAAQAAVDRSKAAEAAARVAGELDQSKAGLAVRKAETERLGAAADLDRARQELVVADDLLAGAQTALERARQETDSTGQRKASDEDIAELEELVRERTAEAGGARAAVSAGERTLALAEAAVAATAHEAELSARHRALDLEQAVQAARSDGLDLEQAIESRDQAKVERQMVSRPADTAAPEAEVTATERALQEARATLSELDGRIGVLVAADEVVFLPQLPARIVGVEAQLGEEAEQVMEVAAEQLVVTVPLTKRQAAAVDTGAAASLRSTNGKREGNGKVVAVEATKGSTGRIARVVSSDFAPTGKERRLVVVIDVDDRDLGGGRGCGKS